MIRKLLIITSILSCLSSLDALAEGANPAPSVIQSSDSRISIAPYDETNIYTVFAKVGYQTSVIFDDGEEIQTISVGDRTPWQLIPSGSRLFIRPLVEGVATNMTLITNKHTYQFDLKSAAAEKNIVVYVLKFTYDAKPHPVATSIASPFVAPTPSKFPPGMTTASSTAFVPPPSPVASPRPAAPKPEEHYGQVSPQNPNFNYTYSGPDDLAPLQVYDDGTSTYVSYRNINQPLPNAYAVDSRGNEMPVTSRIIGDKMAVDAVAGKMALKNSNGTVYIYNETINPR